RHPCRFPPQIPVEFRPAWFNGAPEIKSKIKSGSHRIVVTVGGYNLESCEGSISIAGKPAPTTDVQLN
ncbi:hypothetical protein, partial [Pseudomonas lactis]|uniref:hypothetical protein n=1 Tax=Pseudomonas lactis TaxID=1615674 RepID=UPI00197F5617